MKNIQHKVNILNTTWALLVLISNFILYPNLSVGQNEPTDTIALSDSTNTEEAKFNFLMLDFSYTSNKVKTKDQANESIPAFLTDISFLHKSGLYAGVSHTNYTDASELSYDLDFEAGFQKYFFKETWDIDLSYTYHTYTGISDFEGITYSQALNLSTGISYEMLYLYGAGNFYLDNKNYFTDFGLSILVDFDDVLFENDFLYIQPNISFTYGSDYWLYDIYAPYIETVLLPILRFRGYPVNNLTTEQVVERYLKNNGLSTSTYSYQGIDFMVPITIGINNVSIMCAWMYYMPSDKLKAFGLRDQSGYFISLSFIF